MWSVLWYSFVILPQSAFCLLVIAVSSSVVFLYMTSIETLTHGHSLLLANALSWLAPAEATRMCIGSKVMMEVLDDPEFIPGLWQCWSLPAVCPHPPLRALRDLHLVQDAASLFEPSYAMKPGLPMWKPGPNVQTGVNTVVAHEVDDPATGRCGWMEFSGGTDWQGYQGVYQRLSIREKERTWVQFRVWVTDQDSQSTACVVFSEGYLKWGPRDLIFQMMYNDSLRTLCLSSRERQKWHVLVPPEEFENRPYVITFCLHWRDHTLAAWVDGKLVISAAEFLARNGVSLPGGGVDHFLYLYNWRARSRFRISDVVVTALCPYFDGTPYLPPAATAGAEELGLPSSAPGAKRARRAADLWAGALPWNVVTLVVVVLAYFFREYFESLRTRLHVSVPF